MHLAKFDKCDKYPCFSTIIIKECDDHKTLEIVKNEPITWHGCEVEIHFYGPNKTIAKMRSLSFY